MLEGWGFTGCGKTLQRCHPEPVRCHSERSEESRSASSGYTTRRISLCLFSTQCEILRRRCTSAETRRVSPWKSAGVARTWFLGPRLVPDGQGKAAELKTRSAQPFLSPSFCLSWAAERLSMFRMTVLSSFSAARKAPPFQSRGEKSGLYASRISVLPSRPAQIVYPTAWVGAVFYPFLFLAFPLGAFGNPQRG